MQDATFVETQARRGEKLPEAHGVRATTPGLCSYAPKETWPHLGTEHRRVSAASASAKGRFAARIQNITLPPHCLHVPIAAIALFEYIQGMVRDSITSDMMLSRSGLIHPLSSPKTSISLSVSPTSQLWDTITHLLSGKRRWNANHKSTIHH